MDFIFLRIVGLFKCSYTTVKGTVALARHLEKKIQFNISFLFVWTMKKRI